MPIKEFSMSKYAYSYSLILMHISELVKFPQDGMICIYHVSDALVFSRFTATIFNHSFS